MKLTAIKRRMYLGCAILIAAMLGARFLGGSDGDASTAAASPAIARSSDRSPTPGAAESSRSKAIDLALLTRPTTEKIEDNLFPVPPPPPPPPAPISTAKPAPQPEKPAAEPTAPPLPFKFLGRLVDNGTTTVYVTYGQQNLAVKEGDEIDRLYRVDRIDPTRLVFVYLPLQASQSLPIGARP